MTVRVKRDVIERLDVVARELGCSSRAAAIRSLLGSPVSELEISRDRALFLLAQSAESGSVQARIAYVRALEKAADPKPASVDDLDAFRRARKAT